MNRKKSVVFCMGISAIISCYSQADTSVYRLQEVTVTGIQQTKARETAMNISLISSEKMRQSGAFSISDGLTRINGISQLNTGVGISKPVIRGLYGNRILTILSGLRFDNQQWQDEHGLGLSDMGIDHVEVIKGPASLLYGSEAVGGVINVIEEYGIRPGLRVLDINTRLFSNTGGGYTDIGYRGATKKQFWRIRAGAESHADYSDGKHQRVLNSRFAGYYFKGSLGFNRQNFSSVNHYSASYNRFGFIMEDNQNAKDTDSRYSRAMDGPHHAVLLNVFSSQNTWLRKHSTLKLNAGLQSNLRMEDEGGGAISLNMHLASVIYNLKWQYQVNKALQVILNNQGLLQSNTNYGSRTIVPDAHMMEDGLSAFLKYSIKHFVIEAGVGYNIRIIRTFRTGNINAPGEEIQPFRKTLHALNSSGGLTYNPNIHWNFKLISGTGFRAPNLAELSSNGLHEGIFRYEIGDPLMKNEYNLNTEAAINYYNRRFTFSISPFYNRFKNYIYLYNTGKDHFGFPVYRFGQNNAALKGFEAGINVKPAFIKQAEITGTYATVSGKLSNNTYLPYIPANKCRGEFKYLLRNHVSDIRDIYASLAFEYYMPQTHPSEFETATPDYYLLNIGTGGTVKAGYNTFIRYSIVCNNLLNQYYYDHLSRFKAYGIHNIGRNIVINLSIPIQLKTKHNK